MDISHRVGGVVLFNAMGFTLILAAFGSGLTGSFGAARLLFGMGRDNVLPRRCFGYLTRRDIPVYNVLIIGILSFAGAAILNVFGSAYEHAGELINFGAFLSFMGVNFATFWQFAVRRRANRIRQLFSDVALPLAGFLFCGMIWLHLNRLAQIVGGIWFLIGLVYIAFTTRAFRSKPVQMDFSGT